MRRYKVSVKFGKKVQKIRKERGISQEKLAAAVGIHRNHMGRIERGETNPGLPLINKIARALRVKTKDLLS